MPAMTSAVRQNADRARFELDLGGVTAIANYMLADGVMAFTHTEVPAALRERGVGSRLVRGALEAARAQGLRVKPYCSFVRSYIARHPEFHDLVA